MADSVEIRGLLQDLCFIKLRNGNRESVLDVKKVFEETGSISRKQLSMLRKLRSSYSVQIRELHEARDRARHTNGRLAAGLTIADVAEAQRKREAELKKQQTDYGF